jgi:arylsulfatase A-like enzyme
LAQGFNFYNARPSITPSLLPYRLLEPADNFITPLTKLYRGYKSANVITDEALEWCEKNKEKKFLLVLNYMEGNLPLVPIPKYKKMFYNDKLVRKSRYPEQTKQILYYYAELRYLDDQLDELLCNLKKFDWYENSLIIITSAHGISLGEWGHWGNSITVNEWEVKIPLLVKYPRQKEGTITDYPVQTADIFPTILGVAGVGVPQGLDGTDLRTNDLNRFIAIIQKPSAWVVEKYDNQYLRTLRAFIIGDEKVVLSSNGPPQVYNLKNDPEEKNNIATGRIDLVKKINAEFNKIMAAKQPK